MPKQRRRKRKIASAGIRLFLGKLLAGRACFRFTGQMQNITNGAKFHQEDLQVIALVSLCLKNSPKNHLSTPNLPTKFREEPKKQTLGNTKKWSNHAQCAPFTNFRINNDLERISHGTWDEIRAKIGKTTKISTTGIALSSIPQETMMNTKYRTTGVSKTTFRQSGC